MFNYLKLLATYLFILPASAHAQTQDVAAMLQDADNYRLQQDAALVASQVSLYKDGELDSTREYHVYLRENRESLVVFKSKAEAGQKMLMLGDNYWMLMPKSRRPIRITPMQKLLGEASVGDISTLTWSDDYQGKWLRTASVSNGKHHYQTNMLELSSATKGASYHRIELWLEQGSNFPVKANLYLRSGKLAKEAWYIKGERDNKTAVVSMMLIDKIQPAKQTELKYLAVEPMRLEDKFYNPAYLSRNKNGDL